MSVDTFSYSVIIRTLGNTGEKYKRLIDSVFAQTVQPEEIVVVLPVGYDLDYVTGRERIVYSKKGMVSQRAIGILECKSEYMLVCDDDVEFASTMVEELYDYAIKNNLDCCLPMEGLSGPEDETHLRLGLPLKAKLRGVFTGQVYISRRPSEYLDTITMTAGHRIHVNSNELDRCYLVQCGSFQCFFIKSESARKVHLEEETWLEEGTISKYASYDDPTFFYKMFLQGGRAAYSLRTRYVHLDATAGRPDKTLLDSKITRYYSVAKNRTIFWYKFLWIPERSFLKSLSVLFAGIYGMLNYALWNVIICLHPNYWPAVKAMFAGFRDGFSYIKDIKASCR